MNETIKFYRKSVYGNTFEYIAEKKQRLAIFAITHKKTLDSVAKQGFAMLGFKFQEVMESEAEAD